MPPKTRRPRPLPAGINPRFIESHSVSARPLTRTNKRAVFHGSKSTPIPYLKDSSANELQPRDLKVERHRRRAKRNLLSRPRTST